MIDVLRRNEATGIARIVGWAFSPTSAAEDERDGQNGHPTVRPVTRKTDRSGTRKSSEGWAARRKSCGPAPRRRLPLQPVQGLRRANVRRAFLPVFLAFIVFAVSPLALFAEPQTPAPTPDTPEHFHNRVVYVPYGQLDRIFGKKRKGILMKYDRYLELWKIAESRKPKEKPTQPPIAATVLSTDYQGQVADETASFDATIKIRVAGEEPVSCPFEFGGVGLSSVTVDGQGASLFSGPRGQPNLILEGAGEKTIQAHFSARVLTEESRRSIQFAVPYACAGTMALGLQELAEIEHSSLPVLARETGPDGKSQVQLAVGGNTEVAFTWTIQKTKSREQAVLLAETELRFEVRPGALRLDVTGAVSIMRAEVPGLSFTLPASYDLVAYEVPNLRDLETTARDGRKQVRLTFHEPQAGTLDFSVSAEAGWSGTGEVELPEFAIEGAQRQTGEASVYVHGSLQARPKTLERARQAELADAGAAGQSKSRLAHWRSFAFWKPDYAISFDAAPLPTETNASVRTRLLIREQQCFFSSDIRYQVKRGEKLGMQVEMPQGWTILEVVEGDREAEWYGSQEGATRLLDIEFPAKVVAGGSYACRVNCSLVPDEWLSEDWQDRPVAAPRVWVRGATDQQGELAFIADPQFELTDAGLQGLKAKEAENRSQSRAGQPSLSYTYRRDYGGAVSVARRSPRVSATVTQYALVESDVYRVNALVDYAIQYAATDELWLALPKGTGQEVDLRGAEIKEKALLEVADEDADVWRIRLHRKRIGRYPLRISYEKRIASGEETIEVAGIRAIKVGRVTGHIGVEASSDVELYPKTQNLVDADVTDVPKLPFYRPASRLIYGYRWLTHPFKLSLDLVRHQEESVIATLVSGANYLTVVDANGLSRTRASFTIRNASTPHLKLQLPEGSRLWSALVGGKPVKPS